MMKLISEGLQYIIRTPRSVCMAVRRHVVNIPINLKTSRVHKRGENQPPGIRERIREGTKAPTSKRKTKPKV